MQSTNHGGRSFTTTTPRYLFILSGKLFTKNSHATLESVRSYHNNFIASWLIYASLLPGSPHGLLNPLTYTFMSYLVEPNEIGKAFAISSIAQKIAGFFQTVVLQNIYIATLNWYQDIRALRLEYHVANMPFVDQCRKPKMARDSLLNDTEKGKF
uniref:ABC transmembrane type-1 domain-containing protein n=1 Tax=Heterorhabditis bacteriophora TaxID=37862 RepID=A0A1I7X994_HETBA